MKLILDTPLATITINLFQIEKKKSLISETDEYHKNHHQID